jgi:hypothetical protein
MTLASTSSVSVQYKPELTFGAIDPTTGSGTKYFDLLVNSESLDYNLTKVESANINATRSISTVTTSSASASGGIQGELVHGEYDRFLQSTLQSTFTQYGTNGVGGPFTTTTNTTTTLVSSAAFTGAATLLVKGQWIRLTTDGANNGKLVRLSTTVAPTTSIITLHANTPISATSGEAVTIQASRLMNGTTQTSFSIQRNVNDVSPVEYFTYRGMTPSKFMLNISSGALSTIGFEFMGKDGVRGTPGTNPLLASTNTLVASQVNPVHSSVNQTNCVIWAGGAALTGTYVKSLALDYDNSLRVQEAVCNLGAVGIGSGTIKCSLKMQLYFAEGATFFSQFLANTNTDIIFSTIDPDGNAYVVTVPVASVATYKVNAGGKDSDLLVDVTFTALRDTTATSGTYNKLIAIDRCGVAMAL